MNGDGSQSPTTGSTTEGYEEIGPVVFQCVKCGSIISDSLVFLSQRTEMNTISVRGVTNRVEILSNVEVVTEGPDEGSTYQLLICSGPACQQILGRKYLATPPKLDELRDCFSLSVEALTSYEMGQNLIVPASELNLEKNNKYFMAQLCKMQSLLVSLHKRLADIEEAMKTSPEERAEKDTGDGGDDGDDDSGEASWEEDCSTRKKQDPSQKRDTTITNSKSHSKNTSSHHKSSSQKRRVSGNSSADSSKRFRR